MRRKVSRKKEWINGHFVDRPQSDGWRKFLYATLPYQEPNIQGIDQDRLKEWLDKVDGKSDED